MKSTHFSYPKFLQKNENEFLQKNENDFTSDFQEQILFT